MQRLRLQILKEKSPSTLSAQAAPQEMASVKSWRPSNGRTVLSRTTISGVVFETTSRGRVPIANGFVGIEPDPELFRQIIGNSLLKPLAARLHDQELLAQVDAIRPHQVGWSLRNRDPEHPARALDGGCGRPYTGARGPLCSTSHVRRKLSSGSDTTLDIDLVRPGQLPETHPSPTLSGRAFEIVRWTATARDRHRPILRPRRRSVRPL